MILDISSLTFRYGDNIILNKISHSFSEGKITVIAGPNGSGKSTLVKTIMSVVKTPSRTVFLDNRDINTIKFIDRSKMIGYISQNTNYDFDYSVYEVIEMGRYSYKKDWDLKRDRKMIERSMKITDTYQLKDRSINSLSGGEIQRVLLARALAGEPKCLILDEPSSSLDVSHNIDMMNLIQKLTKEYSLTTIIVLHDFNTILHYSDEIVLLKNGKIKFSGITSNLFTPKIIKDIYGVNTFLIKDECGKEHILTK